mmetsp:Transcript_62599/g.149281  ORF Transcript_62599/g.149281 Transcript_62599/m.149281 type:complete len:204 (+) Transcript_62599:242-853(+)
MDPCHTCVLAGSCRAEILPRLEGSLADSLRLFAQPWGHIHLLGDKAAKLPYQVLQLQEFLPHKLSKLHHVLHCGGVGTAQSQHCMHELGEGDYFTVFEEKLAVLQGNCGVDTQLAQRFQGIRLGEKQREFLFRDHSVAILILILICPDHFPQHILREVGDQLLSLHGRNGFHRLHQNSQKHVHDCQRSQQNEEQDQDPHEHAF